ncbi:MAG: protein kinase, partial [Planctomycetes bacterium]|nr:protein kinase [Planctomycetota bacterium]
MSDDGVPPPREQFNRTVPAAEFLSRAADLGSTCRVREDPVIAGQPELSGQGLGRRLSEQGLPSVGPTGARFVVESLLGVGANGQVYAVIDQNLDRPLAAKFLKKDPLDLETIEHFVDEARITASLQHPNVLPVYELDISSRGEIYFTMKRIDGASLGDALTTSTAEVRSRAIAQMNDVVAIFISVAQALSYAHHRGIIHQDIKPDNIMLGDFGEVLLVDWGSAIRVDDPHPKLYGTPLYMSPEQARLERSDTRSDIYALGASLFHTLTLRPPTWSDDAEEFWKRKRSGGIDAPTAADRQRLPPALLAIALKALAPDPAGRYQTAADFRQDLQQYQAGLAVSALRDNWLARFRRWHRRHAKRVWTTAAAAAVILTLGLLLYGERLKEVATWGQPLVDETFTDGRWKDRWETATGEWAAGDSGIHTKGSENILLCKTRLSGDIAVQYDAEMAIGARPGDISVLWIPDATMFRTNREYGVHYCQIGARDNTFSAILSDHQYLAYSDFRPRPGVVYRIRLEIVDNQMTMSVDGRQICRFINQMPFTGGRVALYGYFPGKIYHRVRIYTRRMAQKLPATAIGDAYLRDGQYAKGITEYRQVEDSYPGTALARQATFREGLCRYRSGDHAAAFARWQTLRGTDLDEVARLHDLDRLNEQGDHAHMLADMAQLYRSGSEEIRTRVALLWSTYVQNLLNEILRPEVIAQLTELLRLRDDIFPDEGATSMLAASALIRID